MFITVTGCRGGYRTVRAPWPGDDMPDEIPDAGRRDHHLANAPPVPIAAVTGGIGYCMSAKRVQTVGPFIDVPGDETPPDFVKNTAGQHIPFALIKAADGTALTGATV